jgi:peptidoglycan/LPS O-acetylase OafA/YrhL
VKKSNRIYQLDLFRFLAALSVVLFHYLFRGFSADNMSDLEFHDIGHFFKYGYLGVDLFFIISGFVITLSIKHNSISKFIISRISRLYPIYWISISLTFLVIIWFGFPRYDAEIYQFIANLTMFHNYLEIENIDGVYWTLFIEMKFYIFIIGSYLLLNKIKKIELDYLVIFWMLLTLTYLFFSDLFIFKVLNFFLILKWSSYFIAGIIFYQIYKKGISFKYYTLLFISLSISIYYAVLKSENLEILFNTSFSPWIAGGFIILFYTIMLLVATNNLKGINSSKLTSLGILTYPLYLIHQKIGFILFNNLGEYLNKYVLVITVTILMIAVSYILSKFYEPIVSNSLKTGLEKLTVKYKSYSRSTINS